MSAQDRGWGPGYPNCQRDKIVALSVHGVSFPGGVRREVHALFVAFLDEFHRTVEPLVVGWCWGFACRAIRGSTQPSNHSWGLAVDNNAPRHPLGKAGTFTPAQAAQCRKLAGKYGLRWGGDYGGRKDEMHFEFLGTPQDAARITATLGGPSPTIEEDEMREGDTGLKVLALQARLNAWRSENLTEDGDYGPATVAAVKRWQATAGLANAQHPADGVFGIAEMLLLLDNAHRNNHLGGAHGGSAAGPHTHDYAAKGHKHGTDYAQVTHEHEISGRAR